MTPGPPRPEGFYVVEASSQLVAGLRYIGPATEVGEGFEHLLNWAKVYNLEQWAPLVGVYADGSGVGDDLVAELWLPLPGDLEAVSHEDPKVEVKRIPPARVAATIHRGYPDELGGKLGELLTWLGERGLERATADHRQVYRAAPPGHPEQWEVELQIPVRSPLPDREAAQRPGSEPVAEPAADGEPGEPGHRETAARGEPAPSEEDA